MASAMLVLCLTASLWSADAFPFPDVGHGALHGAVQEGINSTMAHIARVVRRCLGTFDVGDDFHPHPPHTPWNPPYAEPPPSSVDLCANQGFKCDRHLVKTADGYVVALIHVVARFNGPRVVGRPPVLVQHGMLMSSDAFLLRKDDGNLPLVLHDAGFDVWVGNYRGNAVSPHVHATLDASSSQFWNYSWHEMGLHDLPAMVDYVLEQSDHEDLHYVGHSMGTTGMLVLLSTRPEYNRKIRLASMLAPVAYVSRVRTRLFRQLSSVADRIKDLLVTNRVWNIFPRSSAVHRFFNTLCLFPGADKLVCDPIVFEIAGRSPEHVLPNYIALISAYLPAGTTIRILEHYYELSRTGKFRPLGYGIGDPNPGAEYNISAISAPIALYYSQNDNFIYPPDVHRLAEDLQNVFHVYDVPDATFNHFDFLLAWDGGKLLYDELVATMRRREAIADGNVNVNNGVRALNRNVDILPHNMWSRNGNV